MERKPRNPDTMIYQICWKVSFFFFSKLKRNELWESVYFRFWNVYRDEQTILTNQVWNWFSSFSTFPFLSFFEISHLKSNLMVVLFLIPTLNWYDRLKSKMFTTQGDVLQPFSHLTHGRYIFIIGKGINCKTIHAEENNFLLISLYTFWFEESLVLSDATEWVSNGQRNV